MNGILIHNIKSITAKTHHHKISAQIPPRDFFCKTLTVIDNKGNKTTIELFSDEDLDIITEV